MPLRETPFWLENAVFPVLNAHRPLPQQVDVAIVGGGYTGLAAARSLARRGASVAVLEARTLGWGASSRNGGMVLTGLKVETSQLAKQYGLASARRMFAASLRAIDTVEHIVHEERIDCAFRRSGHLLLASKPRHLRAMAHEVALLAREFNHPAEMLSASDVRREIGSHLFHGGLLDKCSAGIDPARFVAGLARAAERAGVQLYEHTPATRIRRQGPNWRVITAEGELRAGDVVLACGAYGGRTFPALARRIVPLGSYIIVTEPLSEEHARELLPHDRMAFDSKHLLHYFRLTPDRRLLFGGRARFFPETPRMIRESADVLRRDMIKIFPQLRDTRIAYAWGGTLDVAFDLMPHSGQLDGLYYAIGYAGHGVAMATYLGDQLGARLAGVPADNPFEGVTFPGAPLRLYNGRPWFLPVLGGWYSLLDRVS